MTKQAMPGKVQSSVLKEEFNMVIGPGISVTIGDTAISIIPNTNWFASPRSIYVCIYSYVFFHWF